MRVKKLKDGLDNEKGPFRVYVRYPREVYLPGEIIEVDIIMNTTLPSRALVSGVFRNGNHTRKLKDQLELTDSRDNHLRLELKAREIGLALLKVKILHTTLKQVETVIEKFTVTRIIPKRGQAQDFHDNDTYPDLIDTIDRIMEGEIESIMEDLTKQETMRKEEAIAQQQAIQTAMASTSTVATASAPAKNFPLDWEDLDDLRDVIIAIDRLLDKLPDEDQDHFRMSSTYDKYMALIRKLHNAG